MEFQLQESAYPSVPNWTVRRTKDLLLWRDDQASHTQAEQEEIQAIRPEVET